MKGAHFIQQLLSDTTSFSREATKKKRWPPPRHNPERCMSAIRPVCCRDWWGKNDSSVGVETETVMHAGSNTGHRGFARQQIILMSNISPFDENRATGSRTESVTAGNDEE